MNKTLSSRLHNWCAFGYEPLLSGHAFWVPNPMKGYFIEGLVKPLKIGIQREEVFKLFTLIEVKSQPAVENTLKWIRPTGTFFDSPWPIRPTPHFLKLMDEETAKLFEATYFINNPPFRSWMEAEAVSDKLRELGLCTYVRRARQLYKIVLKSQGGPSE